MSLNLNITKSSQRASLADDKTQLDITGEVHTILCKDNIKCKLDALVVKNLDVDLLAGNPFLMDNHVSIDFSNRIIHIQTKVFDMKQTLPMLVYLTLKFYAQTDQQ